MIEVYKTDITDAVQASLLAEHIQGLYRDYAVNFDLDDCDHIMRIVSKLDIDSSQIVELVRNFGFKAEVLEDDIQTESSLLRYDTNMFFN